MSIFAQTQPKRNVEPIYLKTREVNELTGISRYRLRDWEHQGLLRQGVHFSRPGRRLTLYNRDLLLDLIANFDNPAAHERAVEQYLAALPSNQPKRPGRKSIAA